MYEKTTIMHHHPERGTLTKAPISMTCDLLSTVDHGGLIFKKTTVLLIVSKAFSRLGIRIGMLQSFPRAANLSSGKPIPVGDDSQQ